MKIKSIQDQKVYNYLEVPEKRPRRSTHPYYCDICGWDFRSFYEGKRHFRKYHIGKEPIGKKSMRSIS